MKYLLQRIAFYLFTAWAAITINFFIPRLIPGDPVQSLISSTRARSAPTRSSRCTCCSAWTSTQSLWQQYLDYWEQLFHGDLGLSFTFFPTPVSRGDRPEPAVDGRPGRHHHDHQLPARHRRSACCAGWRRGSWVDGLLPVTTFLSSVPYFWLGLVAIALFAGPGSFFPSSGGFDPGLVPALGPVLHRPARSSTACCRR